MIKTFLINTLLGVTCMFPGYVLLERYGVIWQSCMVLLLGGSLWLPLSEQLKKINKRRK